MGGLFYFKSLLSGLRRHIEATWVLNASSWVVFPGLKLGSTQAARGLARQAYCISVFGNR